MRPVRSMSIFPFRAKIVRFPRTFTASRCFAVACMVAIIFVAGVPAAPGPSARLIARQGTSGAAVARDHYFEYHSAFWLNLHLFLYEEAATRAALPQKPREAELTGDSSLSASLSGDEKAKWDAAIVYYQSNLLSLDLLTSDRMRQLNNTLAALEDASTIGRSRLDPQLVRVLDNAAEVYRAHWWTAHDRANRDWIAAVTPLVQSDGDQLARQLAAAYGEPWADGPIRVDVVAYANSSGAFTVMHPTRITVSSQDLANQKLAGLDALFREASHPMIENVGNLAIQDFAAHKRNPPSDLWHAIVRFTADYYLKQLHPDYLVSADEEQLWKQGRWPIYEEALQKSWQPHLEGKSSVAAAVSQLVTAITAAH